MDHISQDQTQNKFNECEFLKRTLPFALSVSVFYFFVWYSSGFYILPQSFNAYFSPCLFSMLTHTLEKKYMFLICNGILAFLAKTSLLTSSPPISPLDIEFQASNPSETKELVSKEAVLPLESFRSPENFSASLMVEEELEQVEKQEEHYQEVSEAEEEEHGTLFTEIEGRENQEASVAEEEEVEGKGKEDGEGGTGSGVMVTQDDESADTTLATNEELANTDELNRRFEEFIRKMKEEIRIEAQRYPIAV